MDGQTKYVYITSEDQEMIKPLIQRIRELEEKAIPLQKELERLKKENAELKAKPSIPVPSSVPNFKVEELSQKLVYLEGTIISQIHSLNQRFESLWNDHLETKKKHFNEGESLILKNLASRAVVSEDKDGYTIPK